MWQNENLRRNHCWSLRLKPLPVNQCIAVPEASSWPTACCFDAVKFESSLADFCLNAASICFLLACILFQPTPCIDWLKNFGQEGALNVGVVVGHAGSMASSQHKDCGVHS